MSAPASSAEPAVEPAPEPAATDAPAAVMAAPAAPSAEASTSGVGEAAAAPSPPPVFSIGARVRCAWRDGDLRDCEILEKRTLATGEVQYYVHYADFNRRLDEWVSVERLHQPQPQSARSNAERKRKLDPAVAGNPMVAHNPHDEAAAGELDAATQREHEAATRVKNINTVVLGKWEIQTWCVHARLATRATGTARPPCAHGAPRRACAPINGPPLAIQVLLAVPKGVQRLRHALLL